MAVTQAIAITRHPYADGSYKKMLIDGQWVDAASGKRFETLNPATGELLATVAEGMPRTSIARLPPRAVPLRDRGAK